jgi:hypothetical protein
MNEQYYDTIINGGRAIPGQSLTADPDSPAPYEQPPEYVTIHEASEWIFSQLIDEENYERLIQVLIDDMPVMDVAQVLLFKGFTAGKWTVDLMMLLAEPTAYMIMALAERAGVEPVIFRGEDEDELQDEIFFGTKLSKEKVDALQKISASDIPLPFVTEEDKAKLEELPTAEEMDVEPTSLLQNPEEEVQQ